MAITYDLNLLIGTEVFRKLSELAFSSPGIMNCVGSLESLLTNLDWGNGLNVSKCYQLLRLDVNFTGKTALFSVEFFEINLLAITTKLLFNSVNLQSPPTIQAKKPNMWIWILCKYEWNKRIYGQFVLLKKGIYNFFSLKFPLKCSEEAKH